MIIAPYFIQQVCPNQYGWRRASHSDISIIAPTMFTVYLMAAITI